MDLEARDSLLRALAIVARSARLCAQPIDGSQYRASVEGASRALERADKYHEAIRAGHALHERPVRLCTQALLTGRACLAELLSGQQEGLDDEDQRLDLEAAAGKLERAIERALARSNPPPGEEKK